MPEPQSDSIFSHPHDGIPIPPFHARDTHTNDTPTYFPSADNPQPPLPHQQVMKICIILIYLLPPLATSFVVREKISSIGNAEQPVRNRPSVCPHVLAPTLGARQYRAVPYQSNPANRAGREPPKEAPTSPSWLGYTYPAR